MLAAGAASAEAFDCRLADGTALRFVIDRSQFVLSVTPEEPIRRKVTLVERNGTFFEAEPWIVGPWRGFHAVTPEGSQMFVIGPDGAAELITVGGGAIAGQCTG